MAIKSSAVMPMTPSSWARVGGPSISGTPARASSQEAATASVESHRVPSRSNRMLSYLMEFSFLALSALYYSGTRRCFQGKPGKTGWVCQVRKS